MAMGHMTQIGSASQLDLGPPLIHDMGVSENGEGYTGVNRYTPQESLKYRNLYNEDNSG